MKIAHFVIAAWLWLLCSAAPAVPPGEPPVRTFSMAEYNSNVQNWGAALGPDGLIYGLWGHTGSGVRSCIMHFKPNA